MTANPPQDDPESREAAANARYREALRAVDAGDCAALARVMASRGFEINYRPPSAAGTLMHKVVEDGTPEMAWMLRYAQVDLTVKNHRFETAYHFAHRCWRDDIKAVLRSRWPEVRPFLVPVLLARADRATVVPPPPGIAEPPLAGALRFLATRAPLPILHMVVYLVGTYDFGTPMARLVRQVSSGSVDGSGAGSGEAEGSGEPEGEGEGEGEGDGGAEADAEAVRVIEQRMSRSRLRWAQIHRDRRGARRPLGAAGAEVSEEAVAGADLEEGGWSGAGGASD